jgi:hypothetical protein
MIEFIDNKLLDTMMNAKLKSLILKYNDILKETIQISAAEDLINLIIVNGDDEEFDLKELISKKQEFKSQVFKEFMKNNSASVLEELSDMDEVKLNIIKQTKMKL